MGPEEFDILEEREKMDLLHSEGVYVGKRQLHHQVAILFQLESFYVEVVYDNYRSIIGYIKSGTSIDMLKPYLNQIGEQLMNQLKNKK